jgi:adenylate kinase family enzyme
LEQRGFSPDMGRRIVVIGTTGSGKTTMARRLSQKLGVPHVELDALHWEPNWTEASNEVFRERVERALRCDEWVVDGNYGVVRDIVWGRADTIIWLDYTLPVMLWRLTRRTLRRIATQEELWGGNRESVRTTFFSRDSLFVWQLTTYRRRRRENPSLLARPEHSHLQVVRLPSPSAARRWLASFPSGNATQIEAQTDGR